MQLSITLLQVVKRLTGDNNMNYLDAIASVNASSDPTPEEFVNEQLEWKRIRQVVEESKNKSNNKFTLFNCDTNGVLLKTKGMSAKEIREMEKREETPLSKKYGFFENHVYRMNNKQIKANIKKELKSLGRN